MTKKTVLFSLLCFACFAAQASAVTPTGFMGDEVVARGYNSMTQVWIPAIALTGIIGLVINCFAGFVRIGAKVVGFLIGICLLGGGLPMISGYSGGAIATSLILP